MYSAHPLAACLLDATRLRSSHRLDYQKDVRWLFQLRLEQWQAELGAPLRLQWPKSLITRLRRDDARVFDEAPYTYATGLEAAPFKTIDADFCIGYGFDDYSMRALNYAYVKPWQSGPSSYLGADAALLGSFAVILDRKPIGHVPCLPDPAVQCVARVEWPHGKTRSVQAWQGVWIDEKRLHPTLAQALRAVPIDAVVRAATRWPPVSTNYMSLFMEHYGHLDEDEVALRKRLGFPPKGKPVGEEILYRSVCEAFTTEPVLRRYRGREMERLELDIFLPERRLAFEYQGDQHFRPLKHWQGEDGFARQQQRDARKRVLCAELNYQLVEMESGDDLRREGVIETLRRKCFIKPEFC